MEQFEPATGGNQYEKSFVQPSMEKFDFNDVYFKEDEESLSNNLVSNGSVDFRGRIASKKTTGGWKASPFIIVNEVAERLAFFAIAVNMVAYLVFEMKKSLPDSATIVTDWIGAAYVLTIFGAFMADAFLGRFRTIMVFSCIYALGMVLLTLSASLDSLRPPPCAVRPCTQATSSQNNFLYAALALIALGTGGIKPCVSTFGADQFDEADSEEVQKKYAFFNWFFFSINMGALLAITVLVYIQDRFGWIWGFGIPTVTVFCSIIIMLVGLRFYRYQKPMGSPFTRFLQVLVAAFRNHYRGVEVGRTTELYEVETMESDIKGARKLSHTTQYRFLDKAAIVVRDEDNSDVIIKNRWKMVTVTQVEEMKCFVRILPIWLATIALSISFAQFSTFFISQATIMDRNLGPNFKIPAGSVPVFSAINALILVPMYEKFIIPVLRNRTGHRRGITSLQRMGVGLSFSVIALASAAIIEHKRRTETNNVFSVFWLFPQFFLMGTAEVFTYVGQLEFFYDEATDGTRSISSAIFLSEIGLGSWLSTALVKIINRATGGEDKGWLRNNLNMSKLDYFYWVLTAINLVNFFVFVFVARRYKGRDGYSGLNSNVMRNEDSSCEAIGRVGDSTLIELAGQPSKK
uniref:Uncharacterized protein n=1 Tax=Cannabis sativa TaxID=3483 RepID=A0A803NN82_CANSA